MSFAFEVPFEEVESSFEDYIAAVFSSLGSEFLVLPKGPGFIEYAVFQNGYEALKRATADFKNVTVSTLLSAANDAPMSVIVVRTMLGFTPPEWAFVSTQHTGIPISQSSIRTLDRAIRIEPDKPLSVTETATRRVRALLETACYLLSSKVQQVESDKIHRLGKADTASGLDGVRTLADLGVPYPMLLYERFLGRPFAGHKDSVSELVGDVLESAIENELAIAGVSNRKTKRAVRIEGFDQAPDFIIPDEFNPKVVIEAKIAEDDGTARDKVTRIQHLGELSTSGLPEGEFKFEVVACISGRGFGVRREDMRKLLIATRGKVFTMGTLHTLVEHTRLREFRTK